MFGLAKQLIDTLATRFMLIGVRTSSRGSVREKCRLCDGDGLLAVATYVRLKNGIREDDTETNGCAFVGGTRVQSLRVPAREM